MTGASGIEAGQTAAWTSATTRRAADNSGSDSGSSWEQHLQAAGHDNAEAIPLPTLHQQSPARTGPGGGSQAEAGAAPEGPLLQPVAYRPPAQNVPQQPPAGHGLLQPVAYRPPSAPAQPASRPASLYFPPRDANSPTSPLVHQGDFTHEPQHSPSLPGFPSIPTAGASRPVPRRGPLVRADAPPRRRSDLVRALFQGAEIGRLARNDAARRSPPSD